VLKTFAKGGVHPPENKISANQKLAKLPLPKTVYIPISQHIGAPAVPEVAKNDEVKAGQIIAKSGGFVSANIHSSVAGKVTKIDNYLDSTGYKQKCIIIEASGEEWIDGVDLTDTLVKDIKDSPEEIINKINSAGIVGLGGATFPSHVKLSVPKDKNVNVLIINAVECEPYLTSDHQIMLEKADEIMVGIQILKKALNVSKALIGIENNKPDAIEHFNKIASNYEGIEVFGLKVKYPQGGEKQLIKALINREVPSLKLPLDVGTVVHNVGTAFAVYEAVQKNKPLVERVVTVTGKSVKKPANFIAKIGTPVNELIEAAGGLPEDTGKVINGGPMMGKALNSLDVPVTKGTSGILIIPEEESERRTIQNCIRCAKCVSVCPMGLEPFLLMTLAEKRMWENEEKERILDCMECGSCSYICPSDRPLLDYIRLGKSSLNKIIRSRNKK
jgi:H+/Na+-translocating ferredoxin:NAD+ oxidoreductase subunit C